MAPDPEHRDRRAADAADRRFAVLQTQGSADVDDAMALGYEAADPSLQSPPWREAMQGAGPSRDGR